LKRPLRISKDAKNEMAAASRWYEGQRPGLGHDFIRIVDRAFAHIERGPHLGSPVPGVPDREIRRILIRRFPYHVIYIELPDRVQVLALAHQRRRPDYWHRRIPN